MSFLYWVFQSLPPVKKVYAKFVRELRDDFPQARRVVDIGTGTGVFAKMLAEQFSEVVGVDINCKMIETARRFSRAGNLDFICADVSELSSKFDIAVGTFSLHHFANPAEVLNSLRNVAESVVMFDMLSNPSAPGKTAKENLSAYLLWRAIPDHFFSRKRIEDILSSTSWKEKSLEEDGVFVKIVLKD